MSVCRVHCKVIALNTHFLREPTENLFREFCPFLIQIVQKVLAQKFYKTKFYSEILFVSIKLCQNFSAKKIRIKNLFLFFQYKNVQKFAQNCNKTKNLFFLIFLYEH